MGGFAGVRQGGFAGVRLGFRFSTESQTAARREPGTCTVIDRFEAE